MNIYKKIAVVLIIVITSYLLYVLWLKRMDMVGEGFLNSQGLIRGEGFLNSQESRNTGDKGSGSKNEGFTLLPVPINLHNFDPDAIVKSTTMGNTMSAIAIKQYAIKSSYQTAWDGSTVSLDQIAYVLSRGARYLDLDVFWDKPTTGANSQGGSFTSVVSYTKDSKYDTTGTTKIALADVLGFLSQYAFSKANIKNAKNVIYNTPNPGDPLFIQLHVKYVDPTGGASYRSNLYQSVAAAIATSFTSNQLRIGQPLNSGSSIAEIMGKAIIVFDNTIYPNYLQYTNCLAVPSLPGSLEDAVSDANCHQLQNYIHLLTSSGDMQTVAYGNQSSIKKFPLTLPIYESPSNNGYTVKSNILLQFTPFDSNNNFLMTNIDSFNAIQSYTAQIVGMMFWQSDGNLSDYEKMFNKMGSAFAPLSKVSKYIKNNSPGS